MASTRPVRGSMATSAPSISGTCCERVGAGLAVDRRDVDDVAELEHGVESFLRHPFGVGAGERAGRRGRAQHLAVDVDARAAARSAASLPAIDEDDRERHSGTSLSGLIGVDRRAPVAAEMSTRRHRPAEARAVVVVDQPVHQRLARIFLQLGLERGAHRRGRRHRAGPRHRACDSWRRTSSVKYSAE